MGAIRSGRFRDLLSRRLLRAGGGAGGAVSGEQQGSRGAGRHRHAGRWPPARCPPARPAFGPSFRSTEAMVRYNNAKYEPDNRLLNDADYARSLGYKDIPAMPCYGAHDDTFMVPYPPEARDTLLVSQLNHSVTNYLPVYPGTPSTWSPTSAR